MQRLFFLMTMLVSITMANSQNFNKLLQTIVYTGHGDDVFDYSIAISGNYAIVGDYKYDEIIGETGESTDVGIAYIFECNKRGKWLKKQTILIPNRSEVDCFGVSVAMSGNYAVIGANGEGEDEKNKNTLHGAGAAYVYERNANGVWIKKQKIVASDRAKRDFFGGSVAILDNHIIIGAEGNQKDENGENILSCAGSGYIFERNASGVWLEKQKIGASDRKKENWFGGSVAISDNHIIVGALGNFAYVFEQNANGVWLEKQKIIASVKETKDLFTYIAPISVSILGNYAIFGVSNEGAGSAYIFERNASGVWLEKQKIMASDQTKKDYFGSFVFMSKDYVMVFSATDFYIFKQDVNGNWVEK